jgi:hypothetical protein
VPLPIDRRGIGMPGCCLRVGELSLSVPNPTGIAIVKVPLPSSPALVRARVSDQAVAVDPGANSLRFDDFIGRGRHRRGHRVPRAGS